MDSLTMNGLIRIFILTPFFNKYKCMTMDEFRAIKINGQPLIGDTDLGLWLFTWVVLLGIVGYGVFVVFKILIWLHEKITHSKANKKIAARQVKVELDESTTNKVYSKVDNRYYFNFYKQYLIAYDSQGDKNSRVTISWEEAGPTPTDTFNDYKDLDQYCFETAEQFEIEHEKIEYDAKGHGHTVTEFITIIPQLVLAEGIKLNWELEIQQALTLNLVLLENGGVLPEEYLTEDGEIASEETEFAEPEFETYEEFDKK
jgi:hypothetical protein